MRKWSEEFEMDKLVSIIIPVYNVEMYLAECIESVLKQTYQNLEILLIDDGSTDSSGKICDEYAKKDKRIKIIHKENGGVSSARNKGLDIAQGETTQSTHNTVLGLLRTLGIIPTVTFLIYAGKTHDFKEKTKVDKYAQFAFISCLVVSFFEQLLTERFMYMLFLSFLLFNIKQDEKRSMLR